ncbi:MrcB family domain-containing protein [Phaeobacter sp. 22II1-1F12B]|uniref:MrcB family domain-containing protein n=1 Tax=Phaeobacter sp. 22II1-1F12B TaxID=1317111 RepID=UPI000B528F7F|nr:DUF3578 domain-containing protein [Phaeobacter sp. 22II1-1F12B]
MLHSGLEKLAKSFVYERAKPFANNELGNFVRRDLAIEARKHLIFLPFELKTKGSVGAGNWAAVPWLGFFDPLVTTTATKGFYVVYLVNPQTEEIFLSLNQGTTAVYREFGERKGRDILQRRAGDIRDRLPEFTANFDSDPIDLNSLESLPLGYQAGHAFGRKYEAGKINEKLFYADLERILYSYEALVDRGGTTPTDTMFEESGTQDIVETRKYFLSRRIERARNVRAAVIAQRSPICEACGLDPVKHYGFSGPQHNTPLEVHHMKPIHELAEGDSRRYRVPDDFLVLCPNCHKLIHTIEDTSNLKQLKSKVKFKYEPKYID